MREMRVGKDEVDVDVCEVCRGVWFDWFDGEAGALASKMPLVAGAAPHGRAGGACPRDGEQLVTQPYLDSGPNVERCPTCLGLFARREVIPMLAVFHRTMPEKPPEPLHRESLLARLWHAFAG